METHACDSGEDTPSDSVQDGRAIDPNHPISLVFGNVLRKAELARHRRFKAVGRALPTLPLGFDVQTDEKMPRILAKPILGATDKDNLDRPRLRIPIGICLDP